jgi:hypothetical protein
MVRPRWKLEAERACFCSSGAFKTFNNLWGEPGDPHPIISGWGGTWAVPSQVRAFLEPKHG